MWMLESSKSPGKRFQNYFYTMVCKSLLPWSSCCYYTNSPSSHFSYLPTLRLPCVLHGSFSIWPTLFISTSSLLVNLDGFNVHSPSNLFSQSLLLVVFNEVCLLPFQLPKTTRLLSSGAVPSPLKILTSNIPFCLQLPIFIALLFQLCALVNMIGTFSNAAPLT